MKSILSENIEELCKDLGRGLSGASEPSMIEMNKVPSCTLEGFSVVSHVRCPVSGPVTTWDLIRPRGGSYFSPVKALVNKYS